MRNMLNNRYRYLQIAFNRSIPEAERMISLLPPSDRIIIEAGTLLIKAYGSQAISALVSAWTARCALPAYVVADLKCMDRGETEVALAALAGASAATCLGLAPVETIDAFVRNCRAKGIDPIIDMMNVSFPFEVLGQLKERPRIVMLHRGVDERRGGDKTLPREQISRIKASYPGVIVALAGAESLSEVRRNFFNDIDISVVWEQFSAPSLEAEARGREFLTLLK
jgi:bifunctional enzyme Fae/Hps